MTVALLETDGWPPNLSALPLEAQGLLGSLFFIQWRMGSVPDDPHEAGELASQMSPNDEVETTIRLWPVIRPYFDETPAPGLMRARRVEKAREWMVNRNE